MACSAGGQAALRVAPQDQLLATGEFSGRQLYRHGRGIGKLQACEMRGDLAQIVVRHEFDQPVHGGIAAAPLLEVLELARSEEHTSELQSPCNIVCRLLLEKKKRREL